MVYTSRLVGKTVYTLLIRTLRYSTDVFHTWEAIYSYYYVLNDTQIKDLNSFPTHLAISRRVVASHSQGK